MVDPVTKVYCTFFDGSVCGALPETILMVSNEVMYSGVRRWLAYPRCMTHDGYSAAQLVRTTLSDHVAIAVPIVYPSIKIKES
jgi:hypothetical protein